ncbi:uncharacterized protein N7479_004754 [Penicillium vulpinum]|uniref:uncharacterized protein n=1 Tax=Penicillium vulpinum TaxID=29845 RepID=UPI0025474CFA|nr:uncharacterized protein N7479_004754 [Penicillium vulpinum]KAJ5964878.1 hypothetical protein N7479_004754 [Penicillium vulpinum]
MLCVWGNDFDVAKGGLDKRLDKSRDLRVLTLSTLIYLTKSILQCCGYKKIFQNPELSVENVEAKLLQAEDALKISEKSHQHKTTENEDSSDDSNDESDDQFDGAEVEDFEELLADIKTYTRGLLDLTPSFESPAEDSSLRDSKTSTNPMNPNAMDAGQPSTTASLQPCSISPPEPCELVESKGKDVRRPSISSINEFPDDYPPPETTSASSPIFLPTVSPSLLVGQAIPDEREIESVEVSFNKKEAHTHRCQSCNQTRSLQWFWSSHSTEKLCIFCGMHIAKLRRAERLLSLKKASSSGQDKHQDHQELSISVGGHDTGTSFFFNYSKPKTGIEWEYGPPRVENGVGLDIFDDISAVMDFSSMSYMFAPKFENFKAQIMELNPQLEPALIDRFANAQADRYKNLVKLRQQHTIAMVDRTCKAGKHCFALGGSATLWQSRNADSEIEQTKLRIPDSSKGLDQPDDIVSVAQFPPGVPMPPVRHLPAKFECPICFEVKKIEKPSDWSKHVHKDLQAFICSFPECADTKCFKREADWALHENERHRQLEWWTCSFANCDLIGLPFSSRAIFVQHLVRAHKMPRPEINKTEGCSSDGMHERELDPLEKMVDDCHHETEHAVSQEPCRFCGSVFSSWEELKTHLAEHMGHTAGLVLDLVRQRFDPPSHFNPDPTPGDCT